jgi:hypothetical protein
MGEGIMHFRVSEVEDREYPYVYKVICGIEHKQDDRAIMIT